MSDDNLSIQSSFDYRIVDNELVIRTNLCSLTMGPKTAIRFANWILENVKASEEKA